MQSTLRDLLQQVTSIYSMGNIVLERVLSIRDLGVIMEAKLDFNDHIRFYAKLCILSQTLGFIMLVSTQFLIHFREK